MKALIIIDMINAYKKCIYADKPIIQNQLKLINIQKLNDREDKRDLKPENQE